MTEEEYARMMKATTRFDGAEYLDDDESQSELLSDALATGDLDVITAALGIVARARGMTELAQKTGLTRSALYAALKEGGNPTLDTVLKVVKALGVQLKANRAA
ncbi:MAG TPA: addiction module antidote protein [Allosphingosinicella sp.]|nr:addiction module antidote protein [Allosphingosinicella sp.]